MPQHLHQPHPRSRVFLTETGMVGQAVQLGWEGDFEVEQVATQLDALDLDHFGPYAIRWRQQAESVIVRGFGPFVGAVGTGWHAGDGALLAQQVVQQVRAEMFVPGVMNSAWRLPGTLRVRQMGESAR